VTADERAHEVGAPPPRADETGAPAAALVAVATFFVVITYAIAVRTARGQELEDAAYFGRRAATAQAVHGARIVLETISITSLVFALGVLMFVAYGRGRPRLALVVGVATFGANVSTEVLKHVVLDRPALLERAPVAFNTYPSGHSTVAMSLALAAVLVVPRHWRAPITFLGVVYASAVGVATLVVGWHRPSDVVGGFAVATAWAAAAAFVLERWRGTGAPDAAREREADDWMSPTLFAGVGVGLVVAAAAVLVGVVGASDNLFALDRTRAFVAASVAIMAMAALVGAAVLAVLRGVTLDPP
jgi:membrane-associated phospholipid phosphatase